VAAVVLTFSKLQVSENFATSFPEHNAVVKERMMQGDVRG
jgi:hypothetical protein